MVAQRDPPLLLGPSVMHLCTWRGLRARCRGPPEGLLCRALVSCLAPVPLTGRGLGAECPAQGNEQSQLGTFLHMTSQLAHVCMIL